MIATQKMYQLMGKHLEKKLVTQKDSPKVKERIRYRGRIPNFILRLIMI